MPIWSFNIFFIIQCVYLYFFVIKDAMNKRLAAKYCKLTLNVYLDCTIVSLYLNS